MNIMTITQEDLGKAQVAQEVGEKRNLYKRVKDLISSKETLKSQITLYKLELEDFAKLCKILDTTNYLTNISEEQMNKVKEIVSINKVVDWTDYTKFIVSPSVREKIVLLLSLKVISNRAMS